MEMKKYDIMAAGHLCIDIIPLFADSGVKVFDDILTPGKLVNVGEVKINTGGSVSNTGIVMKKLGLNVCFCACVGDDALGRITTDMLKRNGSAEGILVRNNIPSSYTIVISPPGIDRVLLHNPGTNDDFTFSDLNPDLISQCKSIHFGYPPLMKRMYQNEGEELMKFFKISKQAGATTSCDMALPDPDSESGKVNWRQVLKKILPYIDIFLPSVEEAFYMLDPQKFLEMKKRYNGAELLGHLTPEDYSRFADEVLSMGAKIAALKAGYRGFYVKTQGKKIFDSMGLAKPADFDNWSNRELWAPAFAADNFATAAGSGDSSIAGFLTAFLRGLSIEQSLKFATCCGLQNVRVPDAVSGVKSWDETTAILKSNMPMIDIGCTAKGWNFSKEHQLWTGPKDQCCN